MPTQTVTAALTDAVQTEADAPVDWQAFVPTDVADHLATMDRAARDSGCGVPWQLLAAIARVESDFGRNMATSSAGAVGYGQFLPSSWQAFGGTDTNAYDYRDALPAIALYLCQAGLARDPRAALFAYNHADWYVDLVLDLAVSYDRLAPGAPSPAVLSVGPTDQAATPIHYAAGRDVRLDGLTRTVDGPVRWLGVPWRGRTAGHVISRDGLQTTTLAMLRAALTATTKVSEPDRPGEDLSTAAWNSGLLALPGESALWTAAEVRQHLQRGQPVVAFVNSRSLPGHPPGEDFGDQPLVIIGTAPDGLVYSDPSFSSSLGYGLVLSELDFMRAWDGTSPPRQALAFVAGPRASTRQTHLSQADLPLPIPRMLPMPTTVVVTTASPTEVAATDTEVPTVVPTAVAPSEVAAPTTKTPEDSDAWLVVVGVALSTIVLMLWRARWS